MKYHLSFLALACFIFSPTSSATPLSADTRAKLVELRAQVESWAPLCENVLSTDRNCTQHDSLKFSGLRCLTGDLERCNDIRDAQDESGRWWRAPTLIGETHENSFSRDTLMGLMYYFVVTQDVQAMDRWLAYLKKHKNKMCDDAADNRCNLVPSSWAMLGKIRKHLGAHRTFKMKIWNWLVPIELKISAATAPKGFPMLLIADNLFLLRAMGINKKWVRKTARKLLKRQPHNPMFHYLVHGSTEELGQQILEACPSTESEKMDDVYWQRELDRNASGELIIIRDDWGPGKTRIPVRQMANGHDCLIALNLAIREPL